MNQAEPEDVGRTADAAGTPSTFEEIISGWVAEGTVPGWPDEAEAGDGPPDAPAPAAAPRQLTRQAAADQGPCEHFVPPEPPPIPRLGVTASIGLALLGFGIVMLVVPGILGRHASLGLPLGLVSLALGLGWFVLRSWPDCTDDDDGAVL